MFYLSTYLCVIHTVFIPCIIKLLAYSASAGLTRSSQAVAESAARRGGREEEASICWAGLAAMCLIVKIPWARGTT